MKAVVFERYGPPEVLQVKEMPKPSPRDDQLLVRVHATTVTAGDWRMRKADPFAARMYNGLLRPRKVTILGFEFAGEVEAVGSQVQGFKPGQRIFGHNGFRFGAYAEYLCLDADNLMARIPEGVSYEQAATLPIGGTAAWNHLLAGDIEHRQQVLVYGASGSVGTFAVQLAHYFGAEVSGVCSAANFEMVSTLGATQLIDYHQRDVTRLDRKYDLIYDAVGRQVSGISKKQFRRILNPGGVIMSVEMSRKDTAADLESLASLVAAGHISPVIDRRYRLEDVAEAHRYVEQGHKKGNVIVNVIPPVS